MPIEELFYHGKNKRTKKKKEISTTTTTTTNSPVISEEEDDYDDDYGVWDDYFDAPEEDNITITNSKKEKLPPLLKQGVASMMSNLMN